MISSALYTLFSIPISDFSRSRIVAPLAGGWLGPKTLLYVPELDLWALVAGKTTSGGVTRGGHWALSFPFFLLTNATS